MLEFYNLWDSKPIRWMYVSWALVGYYTNAIAVRQMDKFIWTNCLKLHQSQLRANPLKWSCLKIGRGRGLGKKYICGGFWWSFLEKADEICPRSFEEGSQKKNSVLLERLLSDTYLCEISAGVWMKLDSHIDFMYEVSGLLNLLSVVSDVYLTKCQSQELIHFTLCILLCLKMS